MNMTSTSPQDAAGRPDDADRPHEPLDGTRHALLSDTVGFIRDLPHHLVNSFLATLEEARFADLLIHVVDASHPAFRRQMMAVDDVINNLLDRESVPILPVVGIALL